jgi:hypothetical protein
VAAGSAGLLALSPLPGLDDAYTPECRRLLDSSRPTRPVEARLYGAASYEPYRASSLLPGPHRARASATEARGAARPAQPSPGEPVPAEIVRSIRGAHERAPSPENRAATAVLHLFEGDADFAVSLLRQAQGRKPADPRFLNDLAAALLALSRATNDPWPALEAFEAAQRSARLKPSLPALFNQALALEELSLRTRAAAAWRRYLEEDRGSGWAREAARRLGRLERETEGRPAEPNPATARRLGETVLLARWAEEALAGRRAGAEAALAEAEVLASTLDPQAGRLLAMSAAALREAEETGDAARRERLALGHRAFGRAFSLWRQEQAGLALGLLEGAVRDLRSAESPFELRARVLRAWIVPEPDWAELRDLTAEEDRFPSIAAEATRIAAFRMSLEGRLAAAAEVHRDARRRFEALGERETSLLLAGMTAELLGLLGREAEATDELVAALAAGPSMEDPWNRYSLYVVAASGVAGRFRRAAVELRLEAAGACPHLPERPLCAVDSWLRAAALSPDVAFAGQALERARDLLREAPDSDGWLRTEMDLAASRARWLAREEGSTGEREEASELLRELAAGYEARGLAVLAARARATRARALRRLDLLVESAEEYRAGLRLFRRWDETDRFRPERAVGSAPGELREVFENLLGLELDAAGAAPSPAAFLLSEEMRDRLAPRRTAALWLPGPADLDRFAAAVPPGTAVVEYAITAERAVAWVLAGGGLDQVTLAPGPDLGGRIHALVSNRYAPAWKRSSGELYQDLVAPVLNRLPSGIERLVLVPDSELHGLPFRALWDPAAGRYLDEAYLLAFAPSARQLLGFAEAGERGDPEPEALPVLALGFPSFFPGLGLKPLPRAPEEAGAVRRVHAGSASQDCPASDWASFRRCAPRARVLHLATHASADSTRTGWSWLAFERETVSLDRLWRELPELPHRPLVVLSACQSVAAAQGGEGLGGLARPFLASGARAVVGTLWRIRDADAARLFPAFHRAYRETGDAAVALRAAREELENWEERPWVWGGVEVVKAGFR